MGSMNFVEEIDYAELNILGMVGKGSFGVVNKAKWRDKTVAVKMINSELERKAFIVELRQLSRVDHPNIVKLYGACQSKPVCLVMEYAEGGSLYNVLHGNSQPEYTAAHAISWALQCSRGVSYLHGMKPKALIHRDLKPPNLLLIMGGTVLKICDFGTACDIQTHMTNNKGSAAWMAPEVFEGSKYSEKCDVFSWGIILWEVLSRQKPFDDIRGSAYQILWAVHSGKRPPLIKGCPKPLDFLMKRCWAKEPHLRPSMDEVVNIMTHLFVFFKGAEQSIRYPPQTDSPDGSYDSQDDSGQSYDSREGTYGSNITNHAVAETSSSDQSTQKDLNSTVGSSETLASQMSPQALISRVSITSAPASLVGSTEDVGKTLESVENINSPLNRLKAQNPEPTNKKHGHKRTGSDGSCYVVPAPEQEESAIKNERRRSEDAGSKNVQTSLLNAILKKAEERVLLPTQPESLAEWNGVNRNSFAVPSTSSAAGVGFPTAQPSFTPLEASRDTVDNAYRLLDPHLQPIAPQQNCKESMRIFEEHKKCSYTLLRNKVELELLKQRKADLSNLLRHPPNRNTLINEIESLLQEKESLQKLYEVLQQQLANTRKEMHR